MDSQDISKRNTEASNRVVKSSSKNISKIRELLGMMPLIFELPTLLFIGMCLQTLFFLVLPHYIAVCPALAFIVYKMVYAFSKIAANRSLRGVRTGRWSASVPNENWILPEKAGTHGVVCFAIGAQANQ